MQDWQERVIKEREELSVRGDKLDAFMSSDVYDTLDSDGRAWLFIQVHAMFMYAEALDARIGAFQN